jgi:anti-sigma factor (TIGR02949 family)
MTCQDPHDLDCRQTLDRLSEFIDGEVNPADHSQLSTHLAACGPCLDEYDVEMVVKALVARSCWQQAPLELKARVLAQIDQARRRRF